MGVQAEGLDEAIKSLRAQAARVNDLTPMFKNYGRWLEKQVDDCFDRSEDWDGVEFEPLAESTIAKRVGSLKAANKRTKSGGLTKGAKTLREKMLAPGGIKPLVDTARARNSQHFESSKTWGVWTAVGYLGFHFAGNERLPARNVSPFVLVNNDWVLHRRAAEQLDALIKKYVTTGSTAPNTAESA